MLGTILLVILVLMLLGVLPTWGHKAAIGDTVRAVELGCFW
jgi:hypothetical protein